MANYTPNYQLHQWEPQDPFLRTDFNQDLQKIDSALDTLADKDQTLQESLTNQAAAIAKLGNCSIERFTYRGTGDEQTTIQFDSPPTLFLVTGNYSVLIGSKFSSRCTGISYDMGSLTTSISEFDVSWDGNTATVDRESQYQENYQVFCLSAK